jgi:hypothetical protein
MDGFESERESVGEVEGERNLFALADDRRGKRERILVFRVPQRMFNIIDFEFMNINK